MSEQRKDKTSNKEKFTILIENYNTKTKEYEIGKQELLRINSSNIKQLLLNNAFPIKSSSFMDNPYNRSIMPETDNVVFQWILDAFFDERIEDIGFHARIVSEDFIITKKNENQFEYLDRTQKMFLIRPFYSRDTFILDEKNNIPNKIFKPPFYKKIFKFIVPFILPSLFLLFLLWAFAFYVELYGFDLIFTIFWSWLVILVLFNVSFSLRFNFKKESTGFQLPFLNQIKPYNLSRFNILVVLILGVIYLSLFFLFMEGVPRIAILALEISQFLSDLVINSLEAVFAVEVTTAIASILPAIIVICLFQVSSEDSLFKRIVKWFFRNLGIAIYKISKAIFYLVSAPFQLVLLQYRVNKEKKTYLIHLLNKLIQEETHGWNVKDYYLQIALELEKIPLISVDTFTKLLALLTFLLSTIPPFLTLYL